MILRLAETVPWAGGYSSSVHTAWQPGETRDVSEAEAAYLVGTFPDLFAPAGAGAQPHTGPSPFPPDTAAERPTSPPKPSRRR